MKYHKPAALALLLCTLLTGCLAANPKAENDKPAVEPPTQSPSAVQDDAQPAQTPPTPEAAPQSTANAIRAGVWAADGSPNGQFYFFDADGKSGRTAYYENGRGLGFAYELSGSDAVFHIGASDVSIACKVILTDENHIALWWEEYTENLTFISADTENFHFYPDADLCRMALAYYEAENGISKPALMSAAADNGDGTVTIQLYQELSGHNSTAAWYQIDRCTGRGKDANTGAAIDLTPYADTPIRESEQTAQAFGAPQNG